MQQYFVKDSYANPVTITDKDTRKHMFQVMRLKADDEVVLVFENGVKHLARVLDADSATLTIVAPLDQQTELPVQVTIASGFPKGDKLEFLAQKTTELGATALWGFPADWSVVKWDSKKLAKRVDKLEKIVQGAAEQSKRNRLPEVALFEKKADFLARLSDFDHILVAYEETAKTGERKSLLAALDAVAPGDRILCIFGPEGGISPEEIALFEEAGAQLVGLGPRILRAETAPLYLLSALSVKLELEV